MARLHEHQGKALLREHGVAVPRGRAVISPGEAAEAARAIGGRVVVKVQAWITGRADRGGVAFADTPEQAAEAAGRMFELTFGNFPVTEILVEEAIDIVEQLFCAFSIDDAARAPVLLLAGHGGTGIEDRAAAVSRIPVHVSDGPDAARVRAALAGASLPAAHHERVVEAIGKLFQIARRYDARSLEINPLVVVAGGVVSAADCRMTIDDYAVFRHPELGIEIARELDHPATDLERIAYRIEQADHRGTFYFAQLPVDGAGDGAVDGAGGSSGVIGFHGAGGGGSMMSMDAVSNEGFTLANFCDTSGNPSAAKVYAAARVILAQDGLVGYFGSGSGVASQEQFHSAYGLAKAFCEMGLTIPAVVRLGGNSEDRAVEILDDACRELPATVEGYRKDDTPAFCARRFRELVEAAAGSVPGPMSRTVPAFVGAAGAYGFPIRAGRVWIDHGSCDGPGSAFVIERSQGLLRLDERGRPVLAVGEDDVAGRDSELIALEVECRRAGHGLVFVDMPIEGLDVPGTSKRPNVETSKRERGSAGVS